MIGFIYRGAVAVKELGERHNIAIFIRLGLRIREMAGNFPVMMVDPKPGLLLAGVGKGKKA